MYFSALTFDSTKAKIGVGTKYRPREAIYFGDPKEMLLSEVKIFFCNKVLLFYTKGENSSMTK